MNNLHTEIADLADLLCDPHQHTEQTPYWDANRNKKWRRHTTIQPGLIDQLYKSIGQPARADHDSHTPTPPESRPPLALEALSTHTTITINAARWCWHLNIPLRGTPQHNIRALVGTTSTANSDTLKALAADLRRWKTWCEVMTGWETIYNPDTPCPHCGKKGTLRILLAAKRALCRNPDIDADGYLVCGATWDDTTIGILALHIDQATNRPQTGTENITSEHTGNGDWHKTPDEILAEFARNLKAMTPVGEEIWDQT